MISPISLCSILKKISQKWFWRVSNPRPCSRRYFAGALDLSAIREWYITRHKTKYLNKLQIPINFQMAFKPKKGRERSHHWVWPLVQISIDLLGLMARRISANHGIPGYVKFLQPKQGSMTSWYSTKNQKFWKIQNVDSYLHSGFEVQN